jgi:RNA polymerase sigma-70 factor, ECF subfamily
LADCGSRFRISRGARFDPSPHDRRWPRPPALNPIRGADKIIRFLTGIAGKNAGHDIRVVPMLINGRAGALLYMDGEIDSTLSMAIDGERIAAVYLVRNPDKLRHASAERLN